MSTVGEVLYSLDCLFTKYRDDDLSVKTLHKRDHPSDAHIYVRNRTSEMLVIQKVLGTY